MVKQLEPTNFKHKVGDLLYDDYYGLGYIISINHDQISTRYSLEFMSEDGKTAFFGHVEEAVLDDLYDNLQRELNDNS